MLQQYSARQETLHHKSSKGLRVASSMCIAFFSLADSHTHTPRFQSHFAINYIGFDISECVAPAGTSIARLLAIGSRIASAVHHSSVWKWNMQKNIINSLGSSFRLCRVSSSIAVPIHPLVPVRNDCRIISECTSDRHSQFSTLAYTTNMARNSSSWTSVLNNFILIHWSSRSRTHTHTHTPHFSCIFFSN